MTYGKEKLFLWDATNFKNLKKKPKKKTEYFPDL